MQKFTEKLHEELLSKLAALDENYQSEKFISHRRIEMIIKALNLILEKLEDYRFESENEETHFFKSVLPPTLSLVVYYAAKNEWESLERLGTTRARQDFIEQQLMKINEFFKDNEEFFKYYRSGKTNLDRYYFLPKKSFQEENIDLLSSLMDPSFCTIHTVKVATFLGYVRLEKDMLDSLCKKEEYAAFSSTLLEETQTAVSRDKLVWTFPKIALIELIYAFKAAGTFNHGKADLKKIIQYFERVFSINLGNYTRSYQEIVARKTGFT
ncbi:MAG: RteC domain-containing protein, partial [Bacteroidota bacterium]|nr:RteC domain-containing protein [Bacteroidota bacterium]